MKKMVLTFSKESAIIDRLVIYCKHGCDCKMTGQHYILNTKEEEVKTYHLKSSSALRGCSKQKVGTLLPRKAMEELHRNALKDICLIREKTVGYSSNYTKNRKLLAIIALVGACSGYKIYDEEVLLYNLIYRNETFSCGAVLDILDDSSPDIQKEDSDVDLDKLKNDIENYNGRDHDEDSVADKIVNIVCEIIGKYSKAAIGEKIINPFIKCFQNDQNNQTHVIVDNKRIDLNELYRVWDNKKDQMNDSLSLLCKTSENRMAVQ